MGKFDSVLYYGRWKKMHENISNNGRRIKEIRESLSFKDLFNDIEVRLRVLETWVLGEIKKNKKRGQLNIDPRTILWILLLILLYLFLKSMGIF